MGTRQDYRRYARECLEMAKGTDDPTVRAALLQMAQTWFRLAEEHTAIDAPDPTE